MKKTTVQISLAFICAFLVVTFDRCAKSSSNPSDSANRTWRVYGQTYFVGSTTPIGGVAVKCAGVAITSGEDGSYEFRNVPEGNQTITAEKPGCLVYTQSLDVRSDTRCYVYLDLQNTRLWGNVSNAIDGPVPFAKVSYRGYTTSTDPSGRYEFTALPWSTDTLTVTQPDYLSSQIILDLYVAERQRDVVLKRERSLNGTVTQMTYVDESKPSAAFNLSPFVYLSEDGPDSVGHFIMNNRRIIFMAFTFPPLIRDTRVSIVDASIQLVRRDSGTTVGFSTNTVTSDWVASSTTYYTRPAIGNRLYSGIMPGIGIWPVLTTGGFMQLILDARANRPVYGIQIWGDSPIISSYSKGTVIKFTVRY